ncbi:hypothetical protein PM082_004840 [Marasmius tenuissimus]|nr:hypothetical protein PM082_004840 [Marasmius tenuissimus]
MEVVEQAVQCTQARRAGHSSLSRPLGRSVTLSGTSMISPLQVSTRVGLVFEILVVIQWVGTGQELGEQANG